MLTVDQTWALATTWYHDRLDPAFRGRSARDAQEIFHALGLRSPFWYLDPT